ncbi:MAG: hypothetical protein R3E39_20925 [Anaerolineae bacterium]
MSLSLPQRYEFSRPAGPAQFVRALLMIVIGAGVVILSFNLDRFVTLPSSSPVPRIVLIIGLFIAISGVLAILLLLLALAVYKSITIEVTETGLTYIRPNKPKQNVKWSEVEFYETDVGGLINLSILMTANNTGIGHSNYDAGSDMFGCLFGLVFGLYFLILESLIGTSSWTVTFKMKSKRRVRVFGYGFQMDELVQKVIPHFLPDKKKQAVEAQSTEEVDENDEIKE